MALGEALRKARQEKSLTASQVAEGTRMKVQIVEALETEDFSKIAAPIYGKGFIKLYAEYVGLDPTPLLSEYTNRFVTPKTPSLEPEDDGLGPVAPAAEPSADDQLGLFPTPPREPAPRTEAPREAPRPAQTPGGLGRLIGKLGEAVAAASEAAASAADRAARRGAVEEETVEETEEEGKPPFRLSDIRFTDYPFKTAAVIVCVLAMLVLVISSLSRCVRTPARADAGPADAAGPSRPLRLAIDPPPPYLD
jgi:cytoskeletal protein RodZ